MNPYTYSKKAKKLADPEPMPPVPTPPAGPSAWQKTTSFFGASVSPLMVAGILMLSSASVFAAGFGVSQTDFYLGSPSLAPIHNLHGKVLGASITATQPVINDAALEAANPSAGLSAQPATFNAGIGRWDYNITYSSSGLTGTGTLTIGSYVVASNLTAASGTVETGAILKPNTIYYISLWNVDSSGNQQSIANIEIKTEKAKNQSTKLPPVPCMMPQSQSSATASNSTAAAPSFCIKQDDGTTQCVPVTCGMLPPRNNASSTLGGFGFFHPMMASGSPMSVPPTMGSNTSGTPTVPSATQ